jgi:hypothetical protein
MDQAMLLVSVEREKAMYSESLLQREPSDCNWKPEGGHVDSKSRGEIKKGYNYHAHPSDSLVVDLNDARQMIRSKSNSEQV